MAQCQRTASELVLYEAQWDVEAKGEDVQDKITALDPPFDGDTSTPRPDFDAVHGRGSTGRSNVVVPLAYQLAPYVPDSATSSGGSDLWNVTSWSTTPPSITAGIPDFSWLESA